MTPEERVNQKTWWLLQEIKKEYLSTHSTEKMSFDIRIPPKKLKKGEDEIPSPDTQRKLLKVLREWRITKEMFSEKLKEIKENQAAVLEKIQRHTNADEKFYLTANTLLSLARRAKELFVSSEVEEKRQLLNFLLQNFVLDGKNLKFELKTPFDRVLEANECSDMCPHEESNLNLILRRDLFYPLNYGGIFSGCWDFPPVNFLTEISSGPALAALTFRFAQTRALLRASNPSRGAGISLR